MYEVAPHETEVEQIATGFLMVEGPVWVERDGEAYLAFSDLGADALHRWYGDGRISTTRHPFARDSTRSGSPNGITLDSEGRLVVCDMGNRRIVRLESDRDHRVLVSRYRGRKLNSPNDLVYRSDGSLYFTDPPHGLVGGDGSPDKEQPVNGVYRLRPDGGIDLLAADLPRPNGIAFSPDERVLYVSNSGPEPVVVEAYTVREDGTLTDARVFHDLIDTGGADGVKVDQAGRVYVATPSGVVVIRPDGRRLGTIRTDEPARNMAWGEDGTVLYITAGGGLYRVRLLSRGLRPATGAYP